MMGIKIPWQVFACAGVLLILSAIGWKLYDLGQDHKQLEWDASVERGRKAVEELKKKQVAVTTSVEVRYLDKVRTIREKGDEIIKKVPVYIPVGSCDLPGGFRLLHDAAATNTLPDSSQLPDAAPVRVDEATTVIAGNYKTCNEVREQLSQLQSWVSDQASLTSRNLDSNNTP